MCASRCPIHLLQPVVILPPTFYFSSRIIPENVSRASSYHCFTCSVSMLKVITILTKMPKRRLDQSNRLSLSVASR